MLGHILAFYVHKWGFFWPQFSIFATSSNFVTAISYFVAKNGHFISILWPQISNVLEFYGLKLWILCPVFTILLGYSADKLAFSVRKLALCGYNLLCVHKLAFY